MAIVNKNSVIEHLSGRVGDVVFRRCGNKTVVARRPTARRKRAPSPAQLDVLHNFARCTKYAKGVMSDPEQVAIYKKHGKKGKSPYLRAFCDADKAPRVLLIDTGDYYGKTGDLIHIRAMDDFKVQSVHVYIIDASGKQVEKGLAESRLDGLHWRYTAQTNIADLKNCVVRAEATDLPGNTGALEVKL